MWPSHGPNGGEEPVAERVHPPHRRVRRRVQARLPAPAGDPVAAPRGRWATTVIGTSWSASVAGDDRWPAGGRRATTSTRFVVAVVLHERDQRARASTRSTARTPPAPGRATARSPSRTAACSGIPSNTDPSPTSAWSTRCGVRRPRRVAGDQVDLGHHRPAVLPARARAGGTRRGCTGRASSGSRTAARGSRRCGSRRAGRSGRTRPAASRACWPARRRRCASRPARTAWLRVSRGLVTSTS